MLYHQMVFPPANKYCKWDKSEEENSSSLRERCRYSAATVVDVFVGVLPMTQSHRSGALTFHVPWPQLVPIHIFLALAIHLPRRKSEHELFL